MFSKGHLPKRGSLEKKTSSLEGQEGRPLEKTSLGEVKEVPVLEMGGG